jgi:NAD(P)-dependent dehydrogenase (short-subunit alcohol dehydrogenase family)
MMSEIMRLEMAPLGVRVVSVILGGVATSQNDPNNREDLKLPENSRYQKIAPAINRHKKGLVFQDKQDADEAAKKIVNDVLSGRHYFIRHGSGSTMSWFGNTFMPYDRFTSMVNGQSGLDGLGK